MGKKIQRRNSAGQRANCGLNFDHERRRFVLVEALTMAIASALLKLGGAEYRLSGLGWAT